MKKMKKICIYFFHAPFSKQENNIKIINYIVKMTKPDPTTPRFTLPIFASPINNLTVEHNKTQKIKACENYIKMYIQCIQQQTHPCDNIVDQIDKVCEKLA